MKGNWIIFVLLAIIVAGVAYWFFFRASPSSAAFACSAEAHKPVIVAYGDSLVEGYGASEQHGFVDALSTQIGTTIINEGKSGDTTAEALQRLPDVLAQHPDIVIVLLGGNDVLQRIPQETTQANLDQILSTLTQNNIHVVLVGVLGGIVTDPFASMFRSLATKYHAALVPNILNGLIGNSKLMYDEVHPNADGYDIAATKIYPALNTTCQALEKGA
jgi:acyl-CoA thioesterase-1